MTTTTDLRHWHAIDKISVEQAGLLIAGVDPFDLLNAGTAHVARGRVYELAIRQASERAFLYAHRVVHRLDQEPRDPALTDIWGITELPSSELRNSVAAVLKDPAHVPLLVPVDPWYSETVYAGDLKVWMAVNDISPAYEFPDAQAIVIQERGKSSWTREAELDTDATHPEVEAGISPWPWGTYETMLLRKLAAAASRFWVNYDPTDSTTAPTNVQVIEWLKSQGVAERTAEVIATILRVDGLPTGPRK